MKKISASALILCLAFFLLIGCVPRKEKLSLELPKLTESKKVDLAHELYNPIDRCYEDLFSYADRLQSFNISVDRLGAYCYLERTYEEQNIQSVEEAINYYVRIDPDDMLSKGNFAIAEINYDSEYDVWCFWLCREEDLIKFQNMQVVPGWCVYFRGNGQFLFRHE